MKLNRFLKITPAKHTEFLLFGLLVFKFFKTSNNRNILLLGIPEAANPLIIVPYIFKFLLLNLRRKRYFVRLRSYLVGTFSIVEKPDSIHIYSLTVSPQWRKLGIATYILDFVEAQAILAGKNSLELSVGKTNTPALQLYRNFGFVRIEEGRWFLLLKKIVSNS